MSSSRGLLDHVVALDVLLADVEQADRRALDALHRRGQRHAHHRELHELLGRAVDVGAEVEHRRARRRLGRQLRRRSPAGRCRAASSARSARSPSARRCCRRRRRPAPLPSLTRLIATRIDESFLLRSASAGGSCISTTSVAAWIVSRSSAGERSLASAARSGASRPDRDHPRVRGAARGTSSAAASVTAGPWSPPIASIGYRDRHGGTAWAAPPRPKTAAVAATGRSYSPGLGLDDLLAAVVAARADVVAPVRFAGHRLDGERGRGQRIVGAVHAALRRRLLVLLDCHGSLLSWVLRSQRVPVTAAPCRREPPSTPPASRTRMPSWRWLRPPRPCPLPRRRAIRLRAPRHERQRQQQLVLDQRHRVERRRPPARPRARGPRRRAARARARRARAAAASSAPRATETGCRQRWHVSGTAPAQRHFQRGPPGGVGIVPVIRQSMSAGSPPPASADRPPAASAAASTWPATTACCAATASPSKWPQLSLDDVLPASPPVERHRVRRARRRPPEPDGCLRAPPNRRRAVDQKRWIIPRDPSLVKKCPTKTTANPMPSAAGPAPPRPLVLASTSRYRRALLDAARAAVRRGGARRPTRRRSPAKRRRRPRCGWPKPRRAASPPTSRTR